MEAAALEATPRLVRAGDGASGATDEPIDRPPGQLFAVDADKDPSIPPEPAHAPAGRKAGWKHIGTSMGERPRPQIVPQ